ncbi:MAG: DUF2782 domain-containing protein [Betaproteobacteria bacterium]
MKPLRTRMRVAVAALLLAAGSFAFAQGLPPAPPPPPMPPQSDALPDTAPPPPGIAGDPELEPQVTVTRKEGETVEEARVNGRLVWIKVTPRHGTPYFLVPDAVSGVLLRRDGFDPGLRVPLWVLFSF